MSKGDGMITTEVDFAISQYTVLILFSYIGRFYEALQQIRRAQEIDPLSLIINVMVGEKLYLAGKEDLAIEVMQKTNRSQSFLYLGAH